MDDLETVLGAYALVPPVALFDLPAQGRNNRAVGVRTGAGEFLFKTYRVADEAALRSEQALLTWLAAQGLPFTIPAAAPTRAGDALLATPQGWATLAPYLPGRRADHTRPAEVEALGEAHAQLHQALARYETPLTPGLLPCRDMIRQRAALTDLTPEQAGLPPTLEHAARPAWWRAEHAALSDWAAREASALPWQVVHHDYDASNVLMRDGRVTGVLDFEFAGPDWRALDVGAALKYTMRWWESDQPWPAARAYCRGYGRVQRLTGAEVKALPWLIRLRDMAVTLLRLEPALAARDGELAAEYLRQAQESAAWLELNGDELARIAAQALAP
ncbi:MAG: phosphotransferase [Anaerolineales bacterium]|nr:phosphotransferase [Anaerolineales bacterium]